jgi:hypothetical protein
MFDVWGHASTAFALKAGAFKVYALKARAFKHYSVKSGI